MPRKRLGLWQPSAMPSRPMRTATAWAMRMMLCAIPSLSPTLAQPMPLVLPSMIRLMMTVRWWLAVCAFRRWRGQMCSTRLATPNCLSGSLNPPTYRRWLWRAICSPTTVSFWAIPSVCKVLAQPRLTVAPLSSTPLAHLATCRRLASSAPIRSTTRLWMAAA